MFQKDDPLHDYYLSYCCLFLILIIIFLLVLWNNIIYLFFSLFLLVTLFLMIINVNQIRQYFRNIHAGKLTKLHILMYFFCGSFSLNITLLLFLLFNSWNIYDSESTRYLISAIIQSESALISIIITLTLIGIQMIAQKYSSYATDIFKKTLDIWIILGIFLSSIIFGIFSLNIILDNSSLDYQRYVFWVIFLFIFCLFSLLPYTINMMTIFRAENILAILKYKIINKLPDPNTGNCDDFLISDINAIFDIIWNSIKNNDMNTVRAGFIELIHLIQGIPYDDRLRRIEIEIDEYSKLFESIKQHYSDEQIEHIRNSFTTLKHFIEFKN